MKYTPLFILPCVWVALWVWGEIRVYRKGGDVYEWTKWLSERLPK